MGIKEIMKRDFEGKEGKLCLNGELIISPTLIGSEWQWTFKNEEEVMKAILSFGANTLGKPDVDTKEIRMGFYLYGPL